MCEEEFLMALPKTQAALEESFVNVMHDDKRTQ